MRLDITRHIESVEKIIASHQIGTGQYRRWLWQDKGGTRNLDINEYGCADAANILYMIGRFPSEPVERGEWIAALQGLQDPETGLFVEATHHPIHTTAHCIAALELFEQKAKYPLKELRPYLERENLYALLDGLDWAGNPWTASHQGAGIFAALVLQGDADSRWRDWYFQWFWEEQDPETGFWRKGCVKPITQGDSFSGTDLKPSVFPFLAGSFHYLFNHEYAHMPIRFPERMIDTCLDIFYSRQWERLGRSVSFAEIDWVYCLTRAGRQCHYRFDDIRRALREFAEGYIGWLCSLDPQTDDGLNDLHTLFGSTCALAELQAALPGEIRSEKPLKLVLDRRPFI